MEVRAIACIRCLSLDVLWFRPGFISMWMYKSCVLVWGFSPPYSLATCNVTEWRFGKVPCTYALTLYGILSMVYLGHWYSYLSTFLSVQYSDPAGAPYWSGFRSRDANYVPGLPWRIYCLYKIAGRHLGRYIVWRLWWLRWLWCQVTMIFCGHYHHIWQWEPSLVLDVRPSVRL